MSIFDNFKQSNNKYLPNTDEDLDIMVNIFKKFLDTYNENNISESNINYFVKDTKKLFKMNNDFWEEGIKEMNDEDVNELDINAKKMLKETYDMLANTSELINILPSDKVIDESSNADLLKLLSSKNKKIHFLIKEIFNFHNRVAKDMQDLNNSMEKLDKTLGDATDRLKIKLICSQFSSKLKELMNSKDDPKIFVEKFKWFLDKLSEIESLEIDKNDKNYVYTFDILKNVISTFSNLFSDNSAS